MFDGLDEVERAKLEGLVIDVQRVIGAGGETSSSTSMLVADAEKRIEALETTGGVGTGERERQEEKKFQNLVVGYLVQQESALSASEKQQYGSFLEQSFFKRSDFEELDAFYGSTFDKLSERGKSEMSHRVWQGIREGEYQFTELPENVREKEMERLMGLFAERENMPENLKRIPEEDREEFMAAMKAGEKDAAATILNRESFKNEVSTAEELAANHEHFTDTQVEADKSVAETAKVQDAEGIPPSELISQNENSEISALKL